MRKILLLSCLLFSLAGEIRAQSDVNLNWIIIEDGQINLMSAKLNLAVTYKNGKDTILQGNYYPGNFAVSQKAFQSLKSDSVKLIRLKFVGDKKFKSKLNHYEYNIDLKRCWIDADYFVLKIFNLDKKVNRKRYTPIEINLNYTFEVSSPCGSFLRAKE